MALDTDFEVALARTLVQLRKREKMTQEELAARAGIGRQTLVRIERHGEVTMRTLNNLAKVLGEPAWKLIRHAAGKHVA